MNKKIISTDILSDMLYDIDKEPCKLKILNSIIDQYNGLSSMIIKRMNCRYKQIWLDEDVFQREIKSNQY
jgi:hypothetical protein